MRKTHIVRSAAAILAISLGSSLLASAQEKRSRGIRVDDEASGCLGVRVSSPQQSHERRRRAAGFSATEILDLEIEVMLPMTLEGEHRLDVKLYTPDHQLYQVLTVPFEANGASPSSSSGHGTRRRKLVDYPRPLKEETARARREGRRRYQAVSAILPVAGTSIVTSSLYGTWTAVAYLDESSDSCVPPQTFSITE